MRIPILHQDPDLIVVDKPAGIPTHAADPDDPYPGDALRIVRAQTGLPYLGMHQRLDAGTSGVLLFAARREANRALAAAFEGRDVRKVYLALVHGAPPRAEGVIDAPIVREHGERYRVTTPGDPRGLAARTRYRVLETFAAERETVNEERIAYCVLRVACSVDLDAQPASRYQSRITHHAPRITHHAPRTTPHDEPLLRLQPPGSHARNRPPAPDSRPPGAIWDVRLPAIRSTGRPAAPRRGCGCTPISSPCRTRRPASR